MLLNKVDCYYETNSLIHKMNPIVKILCFILFIIIISSNTLIINLILIDLLALCIFLSRVPLSIYLELVIRLKVILLLTFIISLICGITIVTSLIFVIKIVLIIWYLALLTLTTAQTEIVYGLEILLRPLQMFKIPVNKLSLNLSYALRFIPMLFNQMDVVLKALASRGLNYRVNIESRLQAYFKAIGPTFRLTFDKIKQHNDNMKLRLFSINKKRTNYRINRVGICDVIMVVINIALLILMIRW